MVKRRPRGGKTEKGDVMPMKKVMKNELKSSGEADPNDRAEITEDPQTSSEEEVEEIDDGVDDRDAESDGNDDEDENANAEGADDESNDEEEAQKESRLSPLPVAKPAFASDGRYRNKQRCLVLCSRGVTARYRHLLEDLRCLLPHHKKESKLAAGGGGGAEGGNSLAQAVNDVADVRGCNSVMFLECRKRRDCYLWVGITRGAGEGSAGGGIGGESVQSSMHGGPSARFLVTNIHTMDELRLTGNCMKGSRPVLTFDASFDRLPHLKLTKALFTQVFGTPRGHPKSKPFVDRIMAFYHADDKIWVRNYQILENQPTTAKEAHAAKKATGSAENTNLVEIGPRFVLDPVRIFRGSFGGQTLYQNPKFVSPNEARAADKRKKGKLFEERQGEKKRRIIRKENIVVPEDPLGDVFR